MYTFNAILSVVAAIALAVVVLHPRIHEGLIIKLGLWMMIFALLASAAAKDIAYAFNAGMCLRAGIVIACLGYALKYRIAKRKGGNTDFGALIEGP